MTVDHVSRLDELIASTQHVLLDFDGPICSVFAGVTARAVALNLLSVMATNGSRPPPTIAAATDPFDVLRHTATIDAELASQVERALRIAEIHATRSATPTPYASEVIAAARDTGRSVAIVSNNSASAIEIYLRAHAIDVDAIIGRTSPDPSMLKPHPHLVARAVESLSAEPLACTLVGDSPSDVLAARQAGVGSIGYANKPGKHAKLVRAGAKVVIENMRALVDAIAVTTT